MFQRRRCCGFDSPGLSSDSADYPGLTYCLWETTP
ncbi:DNA-directed RNA polymerase [Segatella salivae]|nr:DNA-directed RNA polymerase [Segatella salivae]